MNASRTALQRKHTGEASELYMAFELGEKNWKLSLVRGSPSTSAARASACVGESLAKSFSAANFAREHLSFQVSHPWAGY